MVLVDSRTVQVVGDWRLPNRNELQSLQDYSQFHPALPTGHPFIQRAVRQLLVVYYSRHKHQSAWYVTSTVMAHVNRSHDYRSVWPVRGGH